MRLYLDFSFIRMPEEALWYYKNRSFEPLSGFSFKLLQDAILVPIYFHFASKNALKSCLGRSKGVLGTV